MKLTDEQRRILAHCAVCQSPVDTQSAGDALQAGRVRPGTMMCDRCTSSSGAAGDHLYESTLALASLKAANGSARIVYQGVADIGANDLLKAPLDEEERTALDDAKDFIREALDGRNMAAGQMFKDARAAGISDKTLKRAKAQLRVKSRKDGSEWIWLALESQGGQSDTSQPRSGPDGPLGPLGPFGKRAKDDPDGPLHKSTTTTTTKEAYISEGGQGGQGGQGTPATPLAYELEGGQAAYLRDLAAQRNGQGGQAEKCSHEFPGGKGCACCDPEHPYYRGRK